MRPTTQTRRALRLADCCAIVFLIPFVTRFYFRPYFVEVGVVVFVPFSVFAYFFVCKPLSTDETLTRKDRDEES